MNDELLEAKIAQLEERITELEKIVIEVREADRNMVKRFIKTVNRDPRLGNLITGSIDNGN